MKTLVFHCLSQSDTLSYLFVAFYERDPFLGCYCISLNGLLGPKDALGSQKNMWRKISEILL